MEIEKLFGEVICALRNFTNSIQRKDESQADYVREHLNDILFKLNFLQRSNNQTKELENKLEKEFRKLLKLMIIKTHNSSIYVDKLQKNLEYLQWVNKQKILNKKQRKYTVGQREIFYAYLGDNIGSEQNGKRPVIILQNDTGNANGNTTIIAPVTTHQGHIGYDRRKRKYYIIASNKNNGGKKYLDFYEIPLRLEQNTTGLYGFVNVTHLREIDRKRIASHCVGKATEDCFNEIIKAINKNLR